MHMNDEHLDALAKMLASGVPRRRFLQALGAAVLGVVGYDTAPASASERQPRGAQMQSVTAQPVTCPHRGRQQICNGACCAENGSCETKGHGRGVSCEHGGCCATSETCCASLHPNGRYTEVCCEANETCVQTAGRDGTFIGVCRPLTPLV